MIMGEAKPEKDVENGIEQIDVKLRPIRHKSLEERIEENGEKLNLTAEYDWGEPRGREMW